MRSGIRLGSRLGFGTAPLMSRVNRRDSVWLLEAALEAGITHFDTARSYGFGEAESAVGDFIAGRRDRVTLTTKVGILPPPRGVVLSAAKTAARALLSVLPGLRPIIRRGAGELVKTGRFDELTMQESLETSLHQLRTDYVDMLLLHEPAEEVLLTMEPLFFLQRMQREGKVRSFGIGAEPEVITKALRHAPEYTPVLQFPHSIFAPCSPWLREHAPGAVFTHSSIGSAAVEMRGAFKEEPGLQRRWNGELGLDVSTSGVLESIFMQYASGTFPHAVVLFTSTNIEHIRRNAAALRTAASAEQLQRLNHLVRSWKRTRRRP